MTGTVQGVGFRPFVYRHAVALGLAGFVGNDSLGVVIEAEGGGQQVSELKRLLAAEPPALARVTGVTSERIDVVGDTGGFRIVSSLVTSGATTAVSIDSATCDDCLAEVDDPTDRRFRYPFINCTNCGPRYTIVRSVPYDRPFTTMAGFTMCPACQREYEDPGDRRFHAQPNACPVCGPQLTWCDHDGAALATASDAFDAAVAAIVGGQVVAVKGVGGFHLAVDATNDAAVTELRRRKHRDDKPFAVMVADLLGASALCDLDDEAVTALTSPRRPIVVTPRLVAENVSDGVAPGLADLGLLLPYSALHHLLLAAVARPIVLTSGNISDEPIAHDDIDAVARLGPLVEGLLTNDRPIHVRCDDSVVRSSSGGSRVLRRSRGYAPEPLALPFTTTVSALAVGAELKSTIAVVSGSTIVAAHHLGDLEHLATYRSFMQAVDHLPALSGVRPELIAHDLHPEYLSTKFALDSGLPTLAVQHHHAHIAAAMVEHGRTDPVLGLAFDGLGFGPDGTWWGGEMLVADLGGYQRVAHLRPVPLPGGSAAIRQPWRMAAVWGQVAGGTDVAVEALGVMDPGRVRAVLAVAAADTVAMTSSMGRLFDAVAALLGCRLEVTYEAQAAIQLEALARRVGLVDLADAPPFDDLVAVTIEAGTVIIDPSPLVAAVMIQRDAGTDRHLIAAAFHDSIGRTLGEVAVDLAVRDGLDAVALSGGVFQNETFRTVVERTVGDSGLRVLGHHDVPTNDGGISIGQAAIAAWLSR